MRSTPVSPARRVGLPRRRLTAGLVTGSLLLVACGGGSESSGSGAQPGATVPVVERTADDGAPEDDAPADAGDVATGSGYVDLVGADVVPAAEIDTNRLPSVVVDDLTNGRKVNFRNLVPQEKPILLWMWAPH